MQLSRLALSATACALSLTAQAQSYRVSSQTWGSYQNNYSVTSALFGAVGGVPITLYGATSYGSDAVSSAGADNNALPPPVSFNGVWDGDTTKGMTTVTAQGAARTTWGSNHARASLSGYTPIHQDYDGTFTAFGFTGPMHVTSNTSSGASGRSTWEELYQIGGGSGTGQFTGSVHIDGILSADAGSYSSIDWSLTTFSGALVARLTASFDGATWSKSVTANGVSVFTTGSGPLTLNEAVTSSYSFQYGAALYLKSDLITSVSGNGSADFSNTVSFTGMRLPQGSLVYVFSGVAPQQAYGVSFEGNGHGTICPTLACTVGGGAGVGVVPEPGSHALLFSGLGVILCVVRRARRQAR